VKDMLLSELKKICENHLKCINCKLYKSCIFKIYEDDYLIELPSEWEIEE